MPGIQHDWDEEPARLEAGLGSILVSWGCIAAAVALFGVMYVTAFLGFFAVHTLPRLAVADGGRTALKLAATVVLGTLTAEAISIVFGL